MFGLFKNLTPEGKLENQVKEHMEKQIRNYINDTGKNEILMGIAIDRATRDVFNSHMTASHLLAKGHGISYEKTVAIIRNTTNEIRNKYLINPEPIL